METRQQQDLELWQEWKKTKRADVLQTLLTRLQPLIYREVSKWHTTVPPAVLESKGRLLTVQALEEYNPNRGAAIGTHITSRLRKLSRHVYPYQNVARLPENQQLLFNTFTVAQNKLLDDIGREPTTDELADELKWTSKKVGDFRKAFGRRELVESEGSNFESLDQQSPLLDFYYHGLSPEDKLMFEDITGYGGKQIKNNTQLCKQYKITQGQLSYKKRKFVEDIKRIQNKGI